MNRFSLIMGILVIMLSSCRSHRQVVQQTTFDSTEVTFRDVEKSIHIPGDSVAVTMQAQLKDDLKDNKDTQEFEPQSQTIETNRTKVTIEVTKNGEIKATAVSKELDEKVTVQEKTITKSKSEVTVVQEKESWFKTAMNSVWKSIKTIVITLLIAAGIYTAIKLGFNPISIIKNLINKS